MNKAEVAEVNGAVISSEEFKQSWQATEGTDPRQRAAHLWMLIERQLLLQAAQKEGVRVDAGELEDAERVLRSPYPPRQFFTKLEARKTTLEQWRRELYSSLVLRKLIAKRFNSAITIKPAAVRAYYDANKQRFRSAQKVKLQQIVTESKTEAYRLRSQLVRGADFARLARTSSMAPEAKAGGIAGWFEPGALPRELDKVVFKLQRGQLSKVVQTPFGFHLMRILARRPARALAFTEVRKQIEKKLFQEYQALAYYRYVRKLWQAATIRVYLDRLVAADGSAASASSAPEEDGQKDGAPDTRGDDGERGA